MEPLMPATRTLFFCVFLPFALFGLACDGELSPAAASLEESAEVSAEGRALGGESEPEGPGDAALEEEPAGEERFNTPSASLSGHVTRSAEIQEDGVGDLYVALFENNPVVLGEAPEPILVARVRLEAQDLNADDCAVRYTLEGIPPREEAYYVITFFDDNGTIDEEAPGPDKGDLMSLSGPTADEVVLDAPEAFEHDMVLNAVMPI